MVRGNKQLINLFCYLTIVMRKADATRPTLVLKFQGFNTYCNRDLHYKQSMHFYLTS